VANITALIYNIWRARNLLIFEAKHVPADCVIQQAMESSLQFRTMRSSTHQPGNTSAVCPRGNNINWTPPTNGALKLNVDAHPCGDGRWGLGIVLRTEEGKCVGAATAVVRGSSEILEGEASGLAAAIDFAKAFDDKQIVIEMDSLTIVEAVKKKEYGRSYWGRLVRNCGSLINTNPKLSIRWTKRTGNQAAHTLANWAGSEPNKAWTNETPNCIMDIIQKEISFCNFPP
jgi:ribonuclease HI